MPLGYLLGWLLLLLAGKGLWVPALILPLYYLADASITLARRVCRRERFWQAHREHFYQRAAGRGRQSCRRGADDPRRRRRAGRVGIAGRERSPLAAAVLAVAHVAVLLVLLQRRAIHGR